MSDGTVECQAEKDIREVWRKVPGDYYSPSIQVYDNGNAVRFDAGGKCVTMPAEKWVEMAWGHTLESVQAEELARCLRRWPSCSREGLCREKWDGPSMQDDCFACDQRQHLERRLDALTRHRSRGNGAKP